MTEQTVQSEVEENLGTEFWVQPAASLTEPFNLIYATALGALRSNVRERSGDIMDYMMVERLAYGYAKLRQREADEENELTDRTRRELNKDWLEFSIALKKIWNTEDKDNQAEAVLKKVHKAVFDSLKDMPAEQAKQVQAALAASFQSNGI